MKNSELYNIELINPKAYSILKNLEDLNLIRLNKIKPPKDLKEVIAFLKKGNKRINFKELTNEVEVVRAKRYAEKKNKSNS